MSSQFWPIILNFVASLIGALGQWLYKIGAKDLKEIPIYKNIPFLAGMICFCVVMALFMIAFRLGGRISITFPVYALTFVWGTMIGVMIEKEPFSQWQGMGIGLVFIGVAMVGAFAPK
jgi:drug/metabolite transporter (DMT)-like permease